MLHIRDTVPNAPMLKRCILSLRVVLEARGGSALIIFPQVSPITMLIDYVYSFRTQDKGVVECSGKKEGLPAIAMRTYRFDHFHCLHSDRIKAQSTACTMYYVICHMADGRWFASRPGCYLLHVSSSATLPYCSAYPVKAWEFSDSGMSQRAYNARVNPFAVSFKRWLQPICQY